jgi:Arc/MetJ-type ribon-helix-helix transcriptional regulator
MRLAPDGSSTPGMTEVLLCHTIAIQCLIVAISVRLDPETRKLVDRLARAERVSRSEIIRRGIYLMAEQRMTAGETRPFEAIKHLIGQVHGGPTNLSERTGERFRELLLEKRKSKR